MSSQYRALISIPITASDDNDAQRQAEELAGRTGDGHVEMVGAVVDGSLEIRRIVRSSAHFLAQLPPDWKP